MTSGKLVIVPTPLGNLGDMTLRALDALHDADVVMAEDTRVTGKLLAALGVEGKRVERLDENLMSSRTEAVVERVQAGKTIAYCSDAGMPGVSDPGLRLVAAARAADPPVAVEVLPGPTAVATAYVASGTAASSFYFGGFFPRKDRARRELLEALAPVGGLGAALIFYESPNRLVDALRCIADVRPLCTLAVCRELTKLHEEVVRGRVSGVLEEFAAREAVKGEIVIVIDAPNDEERAASQAAASASAADRATELTTQGMSAKQVAKELAREFGLPRNEAYDLALAARER